MAKKKAVRRSATKRQSSKSTNAKSARKLAQKKSVKQTKKKITTHINLIGSKLLANYESLEAEISKISDALQILRKKSQLVRRSLAYLEKEQKRVSKQLQEAHRYLLRLKNKGKKAIKGLPGNAEDVFLQIKEELHKLSSWFGR